MNDADLVRVFRSYLDHDHDPYPYQLEVAKHLLAGRSVILKAPTGSGKTLAALFPFVAAKVLGLQFPRQMLHAAPLRVLVEQFYQKARGTGAELDVRRQTGEVKEDPLLEAEVTYLTIDQLLTSALSLAVLPERLTGFTAQAVAGAYLVLDEFHLYEPDTALATLLELLTQRGSSAPFLLMSATVSSLMLQGLATALNVGKSAQAVMVVEVGADELVQISSGARRTFHTAPALTALGILRRHKGRTIVVCNTVARAQALYLGLLSRGRTVDNTILLHSRFTAADRSRIVGRIQECFGKDAVAEDIILITTQVIEVGLDVSATVLLTELAPASSLIQRAGRCARFAGEEGAVYVHAPPVDVQGEASNLPYDQDLCERTAQAIEAIAGRVVDYTTECKLVDYVHGWADEEAFARTMAGRQARRQLIAKTLRLQGGVGRLEAAQALVRGQSGVSFIISAPPNHNNNNFVVALGTMTSFWRKTQSVGVALHYRTGEGAWLPVVQADDFTRASYFALHPRFASYSAQLGLQLRPSGDGNATELEANSLPSSVYMPMPAAKMTLPRAYLTLTRLRKIRTSVL